MKLVPYIPLEDKRKFSYEIAEKDVLAFRQSNLLGWEEPIPKKETTVAYIDTNLLAQGFEISTLIASIFLLQQTKAVAIHSTENFYTYFKLAVESEKFNYPPLSARFVFPQVDAKPIDVAEEPKTKSADKVELETIFNGLAKNWREATGGYSLTMRRYAHGSYQSILVLEPKKDVISLILRELQQRPDRWFEALKALTNTNPAQNAKTFDETVQCWIEWGQRKNYIS